MSDENFGYNPGIGAHEIRQPKTSSPLCNPHVFLTSPTLQEKMKNIDWSNYKTTYVESGSPVKGKKTFKKEDKKPG